MSAQGMVYIGYKQTPWGDGFNKAVGNWEKALLRQVEYALIGGTHMQKA